MAREEHGAPIEGNAEAALKEWGGHTEYRQLNHEKASWEASDGNADEAMKAWGGVKSATFNNSVLRQGKVELPSIREDTPKDESGHKY